MFKRGSVLLALALAQASCVCALAAVPAGYNAGQIPNLKVWDEANSQHNLWDQLRAAGSGPVIVLPVYTRCTMSCPVLARMLVQQTAQLGSATPYRVLIFSFDPGDDAAALRQFREEKKLPREWMLVRSSAPEIRRFCDFFRYSILTEGPVMIHTNQMFLLDHNLRWRATFTGESWDAAELSTWMRRAESPGLFGWLAMNPEMLLYAGIGGMFLGLLVILGALLLRTRSSPGPAASGV